MEELENDEQIIPQILTLSELLRLSRPLTGASSLNHSRPIKPRSPLDPTTPLSPTQNSNPITLKSLNRPTIISGTLTLPTLATSSPLYPSSFMFSDGLSTVHCDLLEFDTRAIGAKIHVNAWNFIPFQSRRNGLLEIISWKFANSDSCFSNSEAVPLNISNSGDSVDDNKARYCVRGALVSVSPVSVVPCNSKSVSGFLVNMLVCKCKSCKMKEPVMCSTKCHSFTSHVIVYFLEYSACAWHPAMVKLVGSVVLLTGLKKKLVFIGEDQSQLMYVTAGKTCLCIPKLLEKWVPVNKSVVKGKGECGSYSGVITGMYMKGMVVELDEKVLLLVTNQQIVLPLSVRVGAIVSIRNVHFVNPNFFWTKLLVLGACFKTNICLELFSPLETGCCMYSQSQSLLGNFIDSLVYSARLWVLLLVSSFRKKFAGIFSEREILGSKHTAGLVQSYATSHLPSSVSRSRHGLFKEYCKHDSFCCDNEPNNVQLKLVLPISNVITHCEATWIKMLLEEDMDSEDDCDQRSSFFCEGVYHRQPFRSILQSNEIGVILLGLVKISPSSGRLQLIDSTGSIDVLIPDLHSTWSFNAIYEVNGYTLVMEGRPEHTNNLEILSNESFSCRSIFTGVPCRRPVNVALYILYHLRDTKLLVHPCHSTVNDNGKFAELQSGRFHILLVTHKYLPKQNFLGRPVITKSSSVFAEALLLPWDLCFYGKNGQVSYHNFVPSKRLKTDQGSSGEHLSGFMRSGTTNAAASYGLQRCTDLSYSSEIPCSVTYKSTANQFLTSSATLCGSNSIFKGSSGGKTRASKLLLEFKTESLCKYELLKVGGYYIIKHHKEDLFCAFNATSHDNCSKIVLNSTTYMWSSLFSSNQVHPDGDVCDLPGSVDLTKETFTKCGLQNDLPFQQVQCDFPQIQPDVTIQLPSCDLAFLKDNLQKVDGNLIKPFVSLKELVTFSGSNEISGLVQSPVNLAYYQLPKGNLISLHGKVLSVHNVSSGIGNDFRRGKSVCIHLLVDHHPIRIFGLASNHAYPVGFGPGCSADFHRILVLSARNKLVMTASSYIEVKSVALTDEKQCEKDKNQFVPLDHCGAQSAGTIPSLLISEITPPANCKPVQFHCRIVAICILLMKMSRKDAYPQTSSHTRSAVFQIPLAGFVLDDGSSSSCFWANNETAVTLLRLNEKTSREVARNTWGTKRVNEEVNCNTSIHHVGKIIKKHGAVTVRNYGSVYDSTSQDLVFSVTSNTTFNNSDEEFLKGVILNACFGTSWTVIGSLMDSHAEKKLEKELADMDMAMHPMQNIWIQEVHHVNPLAEARRVMQELLN